MAFQRGAPRLANCHKVIKNSVRHVLIEDTFIAEPLKVQFQALEFNTTARRHIPENQRPEIWLTSFGADRRKLGAFYFDLIFAIRETVLKNFQLLLKGRTHRSEFSKGSRKLVVCGQYEN